ncbi:MAG: Replication factor A protein 1 [Stictis urceolatum]|nr:Replication factor A protein 1 [Stictis urceolata]
MSNLETVVDKGSLRAVFDGSLPSITPQPVMQCLQVKPMAGQQGQPERYRVVFSDINNFVQSMLATQANHVVTEGRLQKGCVVRLKSFQANKVKGRRILIVLDLEVLEEHGVHEKAGTPEALEIKEEEDTKPTAISSNGFYGNKPQQSMPQQQLPSRTSAPQSTSHGNIYPIEALSPYAHKWTIKARVTNKSEIKTWHNKNGEGKLFSVNLLDESGEIKATGFKDQCDAFYDLFQEGSVYYISSPCRVQLAKKQFSNLTNDYELTFERDTMIEKSEEQDDVPQVRYNFVSIGDLSTYEKDAVVDTIGVLTDVGETNQIVAKATSKPYEKRELTLVDNTQFKIRVTLWGNTATNFESPLESVIALKGLKVSDFGGKSLSLLSSGSMNVNPDIEEAYKLKGWYDAQGRNSEFENHQSTGNALGAATGQRDNSKTIIQVKDEQLGMSENPDYFSVKATIIYITQKNVSYPACLSEGCNKKVVEMDGMWRCEKCDKNHPRPEYRYIMSVNVADHTGQFWLSCFDETGRQIMGISADKLVEFQESGDDKAAQDAFQEANSQTFIFRCRAKIDNFQDNQRVRYQVVGAAPVNFSQESAKLMSLLKLYD